MDIDASLPTILPDLSQNLNSALSGAVNYFPPELRQIIRHTSSYLPAEIDFVASAKFLVYFAVASLIMGVLSRVVLGKRSSLNHSLSSVIGILFIYAITVAVYTFRPQNFDWLLTPLPFVAFSGDYLIVFPLGDLDFFPLCEELLSLVILAFLVNFLDSMIPKGRTAVGWYLYRLLCVTCSFVLHWAVRYLFHAYMPDLLVSYAPTVLLIILAVTLLSGIISLVLGFVIAIANPFLGAMYTFFFSNCVGKQLSKAVFTSVILCCIVYLLGYFGYTVICISASALAAYIPLLIVLLLLWYLIGHTL